VLYVEVKKGVLGVELPVQMLSGLIEFCCGLGYTICWQGVE